MIALLAPLLLMPSLVVMWAAITGSPVTPWAAANVALFLPVMAVSIVLHELGHMAAARAVGLRVPRVEMGLGRRVGKRRWRRTLFVLNALPLGGQTFVSVDDGVPPRGRAWLTVLAGPVATAALGAAAWAALGQPNVLTLFAPASIANRLAPAELLGFASAWLLVFNVVPWPLLFPAAVQRNDGTLLLTLPSAPAEFLQELDVMSAVAEAMELWEAEQHAQARALVEAALAKAPRSVIARNSLAIVLIHERRLREAREVLLGLLAEKPNDAFLWILRNNIASVDFEIRDDELRAEADEHSAAVAARFNEMGFALGTRGAVLHWLGRHEEAVTLLSRAYDRTSGPDQRAWQASVLSMALAALGRRDEARRWLARAEENRPACPLIPEARVRLEDSSAA